MSIGKDIGKSIGKSIGIPKEIKPDEYRVGLVPSGLRELKLSGAGEIYVERGAGIGVGYSDEDYINAGGSIVDSARELYELSDLVIKVKEPQEEEIGYLRSGQVLFCYLHLAPDNKLTEGLLSSGAIGIAYETITDTSGNLPLLAPMSEIAGRLSVQAGARCLEKIMGGSGTLLGGSGGVLAGKVLVLGGGVAGLNAARIALGMGAQTTIAERSMGRIRYLQDVFGSRVQTLFSTQSLIEELLGDIDLVVGAVLLPGSAAPKILTRGMLKIMKEGSVFVDISIDQGGCAETSRATTHSSPTYVEEGVVHYCVSNMPGAVARTSTSALSNAVLPYAQRLVREGWREALLAEEGFLRGLNVAFGKLTIKAVADSQGREYHEARKAIQI